ncbi:MAG TPA: hypothetical protein VE338_19160 [Ktedonobacterales bacterium]|nr:hypothetical protein [Ktedonobacterales bacterium]
MPSFLTMFTRSALYANLTPGERAFLRFLGVLFSGSFLSAAQAVIPLLNAANPLDPASVPWASVGHTFLATFALAVWLGIGKYRSAQGDPPLPIAGAAPVGPSYPVAPPASTLVVAPPVTPATPAAG